MKFFLDELRIIPRVVWAIAVIVAGGMCWLIWTLGIAQNPDMQHWPTAVRITFLTWISLFFFALVLLFGYINADARRRGMRYVMWTLLSMFIPYGIGIILYFVLRDPLLVACSKCGAKGRSNFAFCPQCGEEFGLSCPVCKRPVEPGWNRCAYCGKELEQQQRSVTAV
jgi:hypothetical protein